MAVQYLFRQASVVAGALHTGVAGSATQKSHEPRVRATASLLHIMPCVLATVLYCIERRGLGPSGWS